MAQKLNPHSPETQFLLARAYRRLGRMNEVRHHLLRARALGWPRDLVQREEWLAMAQSGQIASAEPYLGELLRNQRDDGAEICEAFVEGYFASYRFTKGLLLVDAWETDFPNDPRPHLYRGLAFENSKSWDKAAQSYRRAVELSSDDTNCRLRLAGVLINLHKYDEAVEHLQVCLDSHSDDPDVLCRYSECLRAQGQIDKSRMVLTQALTRDPHHQQSRLNMGQLELMGGDFEAAIRWLRRLCDETPTDVEARYALAQSLQAAGQTDAARSHFDFVTESREKMQEVQRLTDPDRFRPDDPEVRYQIGIRLLRYDNPSHGAAWLRSVLEVDPGHQATHATLAEFYASIGSTDLAEHHRIQLTADANQP